MGIKSIFKKIFGWIPNLFRKIDLDKAERFANIIVDLGIEALPYVELVALATSNKADDLVIMAAKSMGKTLKDILNEKDREKRKGLLLSLAALTIKEGIKHRFNNNTKAILIGDILVDTIEKLDHIDDDFWRSAAQNAFSIWKHSRK